MTPELMAVTAALLGLTSTLQTTDAGSDTPTDPPEGEVVPLVKAEEDATPSLNELKDASEVEDHPRGKKPAVVKVVCRCLGDAVYKSIVLLLAVGLLAALKAGASACGLPAK